MLQIPLNQRIAAAPMELITHVAQYNLATNQPDLPASDNTSADFLNDIQHALAELPASITEKLAPRLLGIFVMSGLGSSAITDVIAYPNGDLIGAFIAIDLSAFQHRKANEWATWRERNPFLQSDEIRLNLAIAKTTEDNRCAAIQYILLHEFGHVMAASGRLVPDWWEKAESTVRQSADNAFLRLSWTVAESGQIEPLPGQDFSWRQQLRFYADAKLPADTILSVYRQLEQTAFPTLYASTNVQEDFAECCATYVHTVLLNKKWELTVHEGSQVMARFTGFWESERSAGKRAFFDSFFQGDLPAFLRRPQYAALAKACMTIIEKSATHYLALAPFLRLSIANADLLQVASAMLKMTESDQDNPILWMNLSTIFFATEQRALGLSMQAEALSMARLYECPAAIQPARYRLLMLMAPGDLAENTPLDCLLEQSDIDLVLYYATLEDPLPPDLPVHDALMVAISYTAHNRAILNALERPLSNWTKPVINAPEYIPRTERSAASQLLQGVPGIVMPATLQVTRALLEAVADGTMPLERIAAQCRFPVILRPVGSHAGRDLERADDPRGVATYLSAVRGTNFYLSNFIDYRSTDGLFRKYRIAIVDGQPWACHMAISSHWMIHYVNAGMYDDRDKRAEEASFLANFSVFAKRNATALDEIHQRSKLDYVCIDCAESPSGELLIFEIDHAMVVHAMDSEELFPHKQIHMLKVRRAVEDLLLRRVTAESSLSRRVNK